jgi:hypothetical protein
MLDGLKAKVRALLKWRWRSSITGRYVTKEFAETHPDTTQREKVQP